jgi:branched-chain amino acid transport system permease protein
VIIGAVILIAQGPFALSVKSPFPNFALLGTRTPAPYGLAVLLALLWYAGLRWFFTRTLTGLAISAIAQDLEAAQAAGIRVRRLQILAFAISGAIVGSSGFVAAPVISISADSGIIYVLNGFIAAVIGGLGSNAGALIGGPLVGVASMYAAFRFGGQFQNVVSLALLIAVLMLRPQGLFGRTQARRV